MTMEPELPIMVAHALLSAAEAIASVPTGRSELSAWDYLLLADMEAELIALARKVAKVERRPPRDQPPTGARILSLQQVRPLPSEIAIRPVSRLPRDGTSSALP
jgi:hypothetical protein